MSTLLTVSLLINLVLFIVTIIQFHRISFIADKFNTVTKRVFNSDRHAYISLVIVSGRYARLLKCAKELNSVCHQLWEDGRKYVQYLDYKDVLDAYENQKIITEKWNLTDFTQIQILDIITNSKKHLKYKDGCEKCG